MQLVVTIFERTFEAALAAVRELRARHDMVEIRVDAFGGASDYTAFCHATAKPIIFTNRGGEPVDVDFGLIDVEHGRAVRDPKRTILSFHDFDGVPALHPLVESMLSSGCKYTKIAVTPHDLAANEQLLASIRPKLTLFGMGDRGLYSRILAPFFGSELSFVSIDDDRVAAPAQLTLDRALAIYGEGNLEKPEHVFAIVGNPAGQSLSPTIHNPLFRKHGVPAAYTIASVASFEEAASSSLTGMSVTAPFKDDAFAFAQRAGANIGRNAIDARAVNTIVRTRRGIIADNTDVDGFETLLQGIQGSRAAVIGAGGTGRAASVALRRAGFDVVLYNRTPRENALPLADLQRFDGDVIIDTLPATATIELPHAATIIRAAYGRGRGDTGLQLLHAQAIRQNALFLEAFR